MYRGTTGSSGGGRCNEVQAVWGGTPERLDVEWVDDQLAIHKPMAGGCEGEDIWDLDGRYRSGGSGEEGEETKQAKCARLTSRTSSRPYRQITSQPARDR